MNSLENHLQFSAGKRARAHDEECKVPKRIRSVEGREAWEAGWKAMDIEYQERGESPVEREKRWAATWDAMEKIKKKILTS